MCMLVCMLAVEGTIRCSVCDSAKPGKDEDCVNRPPPAQLCKGYDYCIAVAKYTNEGQYEFQVRIAKGEASDQLTYTTSSQKSHTRIRFSRSTNLRSRRHYKKGNFVTYSGLGRVGSGRVTANEPTDILTLVRFCWGRPEAPSFRLLPL